MPTVAAAVDLVIQLSLGPDGVRRVDEVVAVSGRVEADVIETEVVFVRRDGELIRAGGRPPHSERFARVGADIGAVLAGLAALRTRWLRADQSSVREPEHRGRRPKVQSPSHDPRAKL